MNLLLIKRSSRFGCFFIITGILIAYFANSMLSLPNSIQALVEQAKLKKGYGLFRFLEKNTLPDHDLPKAIWFLNKNQDYTSYILLMVIRQHHPDSYKQIPGRVRAKILCSALSNLYNINEWGYIGPKGDDYDNELAKALLETGNAAIPFLIPILNDDSSAPAAGSKAATMSSVYSYRRNDFAYRYICLIRGEIPMFDPDPAKRDLHIAQLRKKIDGK